MEKILSEDSKSIGISLKFTININQKWDILILKFKKREALENVLIPYREDENLELLKKAGFIKIEKFLSGLIGRVL